MILSIVMLTFLKVDLNHLNIDHNFVAKKCAYPHCHTNCTFARFHDDWWARRNNEVYLSYSVLPYQFELYLLYLALIPIRIIIIITIAVCNTASTQSKIRKYYVLYSFCDVPGNDHCPSTDTTMKKYFFMRKTNTQNTSIYLRHTE